MDATDIKIKLLQRGITQLDLARRWKRPMSTVSMLVNRKMKSRELERKLARALNIPVEELRGE
jgi:transcriptional regulator with XRE-family HTH domain